MAHREIEVWTLTTCIPQDQQPCIPDVYGSYQEAYADYDKKMREFWAMDPPCDDDGTALSYPGDPEEADEALMAERDSWGRHVLSQHMINIEL